MTGRHRSPPEPAPPMLARWLPHIAVLAVVGIVGPPVWLFAATIGADASAASAAAARDSVTVSTAARSARTVHVPLTVLPVPVPSIGAEGAWDPEATPSAPRGAPETFRGVSTVASAPVRTVTGPTEVSSPIEATPTQQPTTLPATTRTWTRTTRTTPPTSPSTSAATTSAPTSTEETTPVTETEEPTPTDVLEEIVDEAVGEGA